MVKSYHTKIQDTLGTICDNRKTIFKRYWSANKKKIDINHPTKKKYSIAYYPDFTVQTKNDHYYIFQILDSQADVGALIIPNVINAYLSENVKKLFFVLKSESYQNKTQEIAETLLAKIEDVTKGTIRNPLKIIYIIIPEEANQKEIERGLYEGLKISYQGVDIKMSIGLLAAGLSPKTIKDLEDLEKSDNTLIDIKG